MSFVQLSRKRRRGAKRQAQQSEKEKERLRPEIPQRTEKGREAEEKDCRARGGGKEHVKPQFSAADTAGEGEQACCEQERKEKVERGGETAGGLSVHTQCAQQVIDEGKGRAEQK